MCISKSTLPSCLLSLRGRANLFYFDILKCATSINVMASALNGLQCPTTQVEKAAWLMLIIILRANQTFFFFHCPIVTHIFSRYFQVCVESCPNQFWAVGVSSYFVGVKPVNVFNQSLCVPSIDLATTTKVRFVIACLLLRVSLKVAKCAILFWLYMWNLVFL